MKPSCLSQWKPEQARVSIRYHRSWAGDWWCTGVGRGIVQKTNFSSNTTGSYWYMPPISSTHTVPPSASNNSHSRLSYLFSFLHLTDKTLLAASMHSTFTISQKTGEIIIASGLFGGNGFLIRLCADSRRLHTLWCWLCRIICLKVWQESSHHPPYLSQPLPTWHLPTVIPFLKCHVMSFLKDNRSK